MNIAQPSLSQFLQQFEAQLGSQLFLRTTRGVVPTVAGKAFIDDAVMIQRLYRETQIRLRDINDVKGGSVRLGIIAFPLHKLKKDKTLRSFSMTKLSLRQKKATRSTGIFIPGRMAAYGSTSVTPLDLNLYLALAYPPTSYRSKAVIELAKVIHEVLEED